MTGPEKQMDETGLDALFAEMGRDRPQPSEALLSRIVADAEEVQPVPMPRMPQKRSVFGQMMDALGGWPALGGLVTATVAGVYIGFAQPDLVNMQTDVSEIGDTEFTEAALWPDDDLFFDEG